MSFKKYLIVALLVLSISKLSAHAIWLETNTTGQIGKAQDVLVFLGEYGDNERDSLQNWFSNTKDFELFLIAPDGTRKKLNATPNGNSFKASFTPEVAGTYTLSIDHTIKDIYGGNKIRYSALGTVKVNKTATGADNLKQNKGLVVVVADKAHKVNAAENVKLLYNTSAAPHGGAVTVQSPAGWSKKFEAKNGEVTFSPFWAGRYMLEGTYSEKEKGTHEGAEYTGVWHCVTYCLDVEK